MTPRSTVQGALTLLSVALSACTEGNRKEDMVRVDTGNAPTGCDRASAFDPEAMRADLTWLASPELDGRAPGTGGDVATRDFVADRFTCLGIPETVQAFTDSEGNDTANILGLVAGTDRAQEVVVITAHIDHFGDGLLGANDNASGVAALLSIAHALQEAAAPPPPGRNRR